MSHRKMIPAVAAALALLATPALAQQPSHPTGTDNPGTSHVPAGTPTASDNPGTDQRPATPGPNASAKSKAKAYGTYCADQDKKHVKGEKGTAFSRCVTAMAKLAADQTQSPRTACKGESRKHVKGEKGTAFSRCVVAGAKLLKDQAAANG